MSIPSQLNDLRPGDTVLWRWKQKNRQLVVDAVHSSPPMVTGKDPATGKHWQVEPEYLTGIIRSVG